jgi:ribonuclease HII
MSCIVGIDEAGRGPLAGPVSVGAVKIGPRFNQKFFKGIKDSKKLSAEDRKLWYDLAQQARRTMDLEFAVSLVSETVIDRHGIAYAIRLGIKRCLLKVGAKPEDQIFLDGGIKASGEFIHQKTIIKGDEKVPVIALASICAKVTRDRLMVKAGKTYPEYGFEVHKGYGTKVHRDALKKYGPKDIHRKSFLRNIDR